MARKLSNQINVVPADSTYPLARIKDNPGDGTGTAVNEALYGDMHQFFARLMQIANVAPNGLPDNAYSGYQLITAITNHIKNTIQNFPALQRKVLPIGAWNMDTTTSLAINHGVSNYEQIMSVSGVLINDGKTIVVPIPLVSEVAADVLIIGSITATQITLRRIVGGQFDNASFDDPTMNRGYLVVDYLIF